MLYLADIGVRQQEIPFRHRLLHVGSLGAIELMVLAGDARIADVVAELHSIGADGIEIGAIRYAREALQKRRIQPVPTAPDRQTFLG